MSMSGSENRKSSERNDLFSFSTQRHRTPEDFTEEDLAFAEELKGLFSPEDEELPPYYAQTLLEAEDPRFSAVGHCFELRTNVRVFRRLELRRYLFRRDPLRRHILRTGIDRVPRQRSFMALVAAFMVVMLFTIAFTGASFTSGVVYLLQGGQSGIYEVLHYPQHIVHIKHVSDRNAGIQPKEISLSAAQWQLHFDMYWPQYTPQSYSLQGVSLYQGIEQNMYSSQAVDQQWSDGPIVEFEYDLAGSHIVPRGTGQIEILEFKPKQGENVLQMVQEGSAYPIQLDQTGQAKAIYIDGQWVLHGRAVPQWIAGERSELIYQENGVVFWIVGDQHDGIGQKELMSMAEAFRVFHISPMMHIEGEMKAVTQIAADMPELFANDVIAINQISNGGPY